jgi:phosphoribosyl 1,2-cyclic phosphodiesterase/ActR/RegA family two-component response regulator
LKSQQQKVMVVDDDELTANVITQLLTHEGYTVTSTTDAGGAFDKILENRTDCIICDLMMPEVDGLNLLKRIRETPDINSVKFIMISAKAYEFDQKRAFEFGADGYIRKPLNTETFSDEIRRIIEDEIDLAFWGVRGTLPASGDHTNKYGGNTFCVSVQFPRDQFFIFDGGSGIKRLGDWLLSQGKRKITARIFISHPHWDHFNAIPFFAPLYIQGNEFQILGANQGDISMRELISAQMEGVYLPITLSEFAARVYFDDLEEEKFEVDGISVETKLLSHPGKCLGYRVNYHGRSICYVTDNEMFLETSEFYTPQYEEKLIRFCKGADVLITDTTYTDEEYKTKVGWGHSCVSKVVELAHGAEVKNLHLFHHDPDQSDNDIDRKHESAGDMLAKLNSSTTVLTPREGDRFRI